jgi:16S rRNA (cytosine967-C5)-methyltransferase
VTPAARLSAAIEVLDRIASSRQPADQALKAWGAASRYAGSKDRRAVADRVYLCLRERGGQIKDGQGSGRRMVLASLELDDRLDAAAIAALFSGEGHAPAPLSDDERAWLGGLDDALDLPPFIAAELARAFGQEGGEEALALLKTRAPLDIRINGLKADPQTVRWALDAAGIETEATPLARSGLRLPGSPDVQVLPAFRSGQIEVQDEGSQLAAALLDARPGETVVDYCAGGGGKTLALAAAMEGQGRLVASDVNPARLEAIRPRLRRADAKAQLRLLGRDSMGDLAGKADRVLVDAPCSGSGTWRRRPEEAWRLTQAELARLNAVQAEVLAQAAALVRPGGRLAYVTCSVLPSENAEVVAAFAASHPDFRPVPIAQAAASAPLTDLGRQRLADLASGGHTVQLTPRRTGTDGFFIALFERPLSERTA